MLLNLYSKNNGTMSLTDFVRKFLFDKEKVDDDFILPFPYECIIGKSLPDLSDCCTLVVMYQKKNIDLCNICFILFGDKNHPLNIDIHDELYHYFNVSNRG